MGKSEGSSIRAESAKQTQAAILEAGVSLFVSQGYKATSIEQIAQEAGVAKGTIYIYYKSKKALFRTVCEQTVEEFLGQIDEFLSMEWGCERECVEAVVLAKFVYFHDYLSQSPNTGALLQAGREIGSDIYARGDDLFGERVTEALRRAHEAGEIAPEAYDESVEGLSSLLVAACHGVSLELSPESYKRDLRKMIAAIWRGHIA